MSPHPVLPPSVRDVSGSRAASSSAALRWGTRAAGLVVTGIGLYVVAPSLLTVLDAWPSLGDVKPVWFGLVAVLELASFAFLWVLLRIALGGGRFVDIAASQLAGNAAGKVVPGGVAAGGVVQAGMLVRAGFTPRKVAGALSATGLLSTGVLLALPLLTIPAVIVGPPPAQELQLGLVLSSVVAVALILLGLALLHWDGLVRAVGLAAGAVVHVVRRRVTPARVAEVLLAERDQVATAFRGRWLRALASAAANRMFDYAALVAALHAVGATVRPSLVLVAYVASLALGMIPITPGGLGFVETGLTTLLVLAGTSTDQAVVATLLYRLASFWVPIPLGALAWGGWQASRRRQPRAPADSAR
jgi:uncharacterized protein (TIRG00374 family)